MIIFKRSNLAHLPPLERRLGELRRGSRTHAERARGPRLEAIRHSPAIESIPPEPGLGPRPLEYLPLDLLLGAAAPVQLKAGRVLAELLNLPGPGGRSPRIVPGEGELDAPLETRLAHRLGAEDSAEGAARTPENPEAVVTRAPSPEELAAEGAVGPAIGADATAEAELVTRKPEAELDPELNILTPDQSAPLDTGEQILDPLVNELGTPDQLFYRQLVTALAGNLGLDAMGIPLLEAPSAEVLARPDRGPRVISPDIFLPTTNPPGTGLGPVSKDGGAR